MEADRTTGPGRTLSELGLGCDLRRSPSAYPGPRAPHAGVLVGDRFVPVEGPAAVDELLDRFGGAPVAARTAVVAVGSNAAPAVLHRKLGPDLVVPLLPVPVRGLGVGHSAHVSVPGFVAAAPFRAPGLTVELVVSLYDPDQLATLDATEPNYTRCEVTGVGGWSGPLWAYDSRWGVIAPPGGAPVPFGRQAELLVFLRQHWEPYPHLVGPTAEPAPVLAGWAASERRRRMTRDELAATGWARPSGLTAP